MADSIDKTTRAIAGKRVEKGNEFESYQEAQNQLLAIQAEQRQNLASARAMEEAEIMQTQTAGQASELAGMMAAENANLNPATQNILQGYGLGNPKVVRTQGREVKKTPNNITINNNYYNTTTNYPIPGRELAFKQPQQGNSGLSSFKTWISNIFAKQNEQAGIRQREYERRERSLTRDANKMIRKMNEIGKGIGESLDARRVAENPQKQLGTLLKLFGFYKLVENWDKILDAVDNIKVKIDGWFSEGGQIAKIGDSIKDIMTNPEYGLPHLLKKEFDAFLEERRKALDTVEKPEFKAKIRVAKNIEIGIGWLVDSLSAMIFGAKGVSKNAVRQINSAADEENEDASKFASNHAGSGSGTGWNRETSVISGKYGKNLPEGTIIGQAAAVAINPGGSDNSLERQNYVDTKETAWGPDDVGTNGRLLTEHATITQGNAISTAIDKAKKGGEVESATILSGLSRLREYAETNGAAIVNPDLIEQLGGKVGEYGTRVYYKLAPRELTKEELKKLKKLLGDRASGVKYTLDLVQTDRENNGEFEFEDGKKTRTLYALTADDINKLVAAYAGEKDLKVDIGDPNFSTKVTYATKLAAVDYAQKRGRPKRISEIETDIDLNNTYKDFYYVNSYVEKAREELNERWKELGYNAKVAYGSMFSGSTPRVEATPEQIEENIRRDLVGGYDVNAAVDNITSNAHQNSYGYCARHVSNALEAGGFKRPYIHASQYPNWLSEHGFYNIDSGTPLLPGDIMTTDPQPGHPYGHVAMWNGNAWVSDFVQKNTDGYVYEGTPKDSLHIYRFGNNSSISDALINATPLTEGSPKVILEDTSSEINNRPRIFIPESTILNQAESTGVRNASAAVNDIALTTKDMKEGNEELIREIAELRTAVETTGQVCAQYFEDASAVQSQIAANTKNLNNPKPTPREKLSRRTA